MSTGAVTANASAFFIMPNEQPQTAPPKEEIQDIQLYAQESQDIFVLRNGKRMILTTSVIERVDDDKVRETYTIRLPASCTAGELIGKEGQKIQKMQDSFGGYMSIKGGDTTSEKGRRPASTKMQTSREPIYAIVGWTGQPSSKHRVLQAALQALRECLDEPKTAGSPENNTRGRAGNGDPARQRQARWRQTLDRGRCQGRQMKTCKPRTGKPSNRLARRHAKSKQRQRQQSKSPARRQMKC